MPWFAFALAGTLGATQLDTTARRVTEAALAGIAADYAKRPADQRTRRLVFDPRVFPQYWTEEAGGTIDTARRSRDSSETAQLARALGAPVIRENEQYLCTVGRASGGCQLPDLLGVLGITIADPRIAGDKATVLYRTISAVDSRGRITTGRSGVSYLARLIRTGGAWSVKCTAMAGTDAAIPIATVKTECPP